MVAGVELEKNATDHEIFKSTIGKAVQSFELPKNNTKPDCRAISMPDPNPFSTGWLLGQIKGNFNSGPPESSIGINLPEPLGCQPSKHSKTSRKPLQPTHWECRCIIARTHHAGFWCVETWQKPLLLFDWAWLPSTNCRFLSCSQNLTCSPWVSRCTDRSRWSLATVTSSHSHAWRYRYCRISDTTSLGNVLSLIGYLRQNWPRKHFMQHFTISLPDWYVAAESRTTTSIWCTGLAFSMTSKPICLKSTYSTWPAYYRALLIVIPKQYFFTVVPQWSFRSQLKPLQASYFFEQILTFAQLWTAFSSAKTGSPSL